MSIAESRLDSFDLFAGLGSQELSLIAANCQEIEVGPERILIQEGQVGKEVYLLESGTVRVFRGEAPSSQDQAVLESPTILGEMAMADPERIRTVSIVAESNLRLLSIPIDTFLVFVRSCPSLKERLRGLIAARRLAPAAGQAAVRMRCLAAA
jgi:CRP-like cAMP-binding protein